MLAWTVVTLITATAQAVPPGLNEAQQAQLATATDHGPHLDEGALYPLLANAMQWPQEPDPGGTINPDYAAILQSPADHRGQLFLIRGQFARSRPVQPPLMRRGLWDATLREWGVLVQRQPDVAVVVLLVDPPQPPPVQGRNVQVVARFFKVWHTTDLENHPTPFLVFVGRSAAFDAGKQVGSPQNVLRIMIALLIVMGASWLGLRYMIRRQVQPKPMPWHYQREQPQTPPPEVEQEQEAEPLPTDPAEALRELERRKQEP